MSDSIRFKREILGVAVLLTLGSLFILYPFLDAIILAMATAYMLRFAHAGLNKRLDNDLLSTFIIISSVIGTIMLALFFFINNFQDIISALQIFLIDLQRNINALVDTLNLNEAIRSQMIELTNTMFIGLESYLRSTLASIPRIMIDVGIYTVTLLYLYKDGDKIKRKIFHVIDGLPENEEKIIRSLIRSIDSIFKGVFLTQLMVAAVIGVITAVGFYLISGLTSQIPLIPLWAVLIAIAALLPIVAGFMLYAPLGTYYLFMGEPLKGSLVISFGLVAINILPEVFFRPYIGARQMNEHPLIIFIGFLAGPLTMGLKGIILGPLILILTKEFILNYTNLVSS